jgi:hypothetical protein
MTDTTPPPPDEKPLEASEAGEFPPPPAEEPGPTGPAIPTNDPRPGAGQPLVQGPPASVGPPVPANVFNLAGGIGCVALGVGALIVLVILLVVLFRIF